MKSKPKIALFWCSSCGGCEESVIDLAEEIAMLDARAEVVFWPVAMDFKYRDLDGMAEGEIWATLINGAVRMDEQEAVAKLLRRKSRIIVAHGACAHLGGVVGLANLFAREDVLARAYQEVPTVKNFEGIRPQPRTNIEGEEIALSAFHEKVKSLDQVIDVDYYLPGCPPTPEWVKSALTMLLNGPLLPKGTVLGERKALCDSCPRRDSRIQGLRVKRFKRLYESEWDPDECFLNQSLICLGPATRGGCRARCIKGNMPCRGCFGPLEKVRDQGAKCISFLASMMDGADEGEVGHIVESIPDPAGLFYRYGLAASILDGKVKK
jgi:F420-non-reducing hydrogenase small subunit